jgi:hypothetical protein
VANRLFNLATGISAIVFCLVVVASFAAGAIDPRKQFVSNSNNCHVSIDGRGGDARLEVFNDSSYGPYSGSIVGVAGDPNGPKVSGFGDIAGIYYRLIRWPNGTSLWTLSVSLMYLLLVAAVLPVIWLIRRSGRWRRGSSADSQTAVPDSTMI